jgi:hypothetical protein
MVRVIACVVSLYLSILSVDVFACSPQRYGEYRQNLLLAPLPAMPPDKVVAFIHLASSRGSIQEEDITAHEAVNTAGEPVDGMLSLIPLTCETDRRLYTTTCTNLIVWRPADPATRRPAAPLAEGDYTLQITLDTSDGSQTLPATTFTTTFTVSESATLAPLAPPRLTATLTAIPEAGTERSCCPIAARTMWDGNHLCNRDDAFVSAPESPPRGLIGCGGTIGDPCQLCWPTQLLAAPRLTARWEVDAAHPAYYKANWRGYDWLDSYGKDRGILNQYVDRAERQFTAAEAAERYCMTVTAVSLIDGSEASAEVCADHAQLGPALPSIPALPDLCVVEPSMEPEVPMEPEPVMEPEAPMEPPAAGTTGDDAGGGCATAPGAPAGATPLWLLGALWVARRRRSSC